MGIYFLIFKQTLLPGHNLELLQTYVCEFLSNLVSSLTVLALDHYQTIQSQVCYMSSLLVELSLAKGHETFQRMPSSSRHS